MDAAFVALIVIVLVALAFDYTNGFHDAANAIAVAVSTKALTPRVALALAAVMNLVGALISTEVAKTVGEGIIDAPEGSGGLKIVFAALIGAITWNLITWYFGLPSSSSHALIGGLVGAALAAAHSVQWMGILDKVVIPMVLSPLVGFGLGYLFMLAHPVDLPDAPTSPGPTAASGTPRSSAPATMALGPRHAGRAEDDGHHHPGAVHRRRDRHLRGAALGGPRRRRRDQRRHLRRRVPHHAHAGRRIIQLTPAGGFAAQTVASSVMVTTATVFAVPVSTTHITTTSIMGVGATRRLSAVRWGVAGNIVVAWVVTLPAAGAVAAVAYFLTDLVVG